MRLKTTERLRLHSTAADVDILAIPVEALPPPQPAPGEVLIEIHSAAVNPSDVKAALGAMPRAVWPRTPGRDWAGVVQDGPAEWIGQEVWGSGGDLGITRDGTHGGWLLAAVGTIRRKPANLTLLEAGAVGVPFITAWEGFTRAGLPKPVDVVLVLGGNGKVGQASTQIAAMLGARVFTVVRGAPDRAGPVPAGVTVLDSATTDIAEAVAAATGGHGADIVYNTVGSPYFATAHRAMAVGARQILIATTERSVSFDIFAFYRGKHSFFGVDSLALDGAACADILDALAPGFASGQLRPFPIVAGAVYRLSEARAAYTRVLQGAHDRIVLAP